MKAIATDAINLADFPQINVISTNEEYSAISVDSYQETYEIGCGVNINGNPYPIMMDNGHFEVGKEKFVLTKDKRFDGKYTVEKVK